MIMIMVTTLILNYSDDCQQNKKKNNEFFLEKIEYKYYLIYIRINNIMTK